MNLLLVLFQTKSYSLKISQNIDIGKLCICIIPTLKRRENVVQSCFSELGGAKFYLKLNFESTKLTRVLRKTVIWPRNCARVLSKAPFTTQKICMASVVLSVNLKMPLFLHCEWPCFTWSRRTWLYLHDFPVCTHPKYWNHPGLNYVYVRLFKCWPHLKCFWCSNDWNGQETAQYRIKKIVTSRKQWRFIF